MVSLADSQYLFLSTIDHVVDGYLMRDLFTCLPEELLDKFPDAQYAIIALLP